MINCPKCFFELPAAMQECPRCGHHWKEKKRSKRLFFDLIALCTILGVSFWLYQHRPAKNEPPFERLPKSEPLLPAAPLKEAHKILPTVPISTTEGPCPKAYPLMKQERYQAAIRAFSECQSRGLSSKEMQLQLAFSLGQVERFEDGLKTLDFGSQAQDSGLAKTLYKTLLLGSAEKYFHANDFQKSRQRAIELHKFDSDHLENLTLLSHLARHDQDRASETKWLDRILALDSSRGMALQRRAEIAYQESESRLALRLYEKLYASDPEKPRGIEKWIQRLRREATVESQMTQFDSQRFRLIYDGIEQFEASSVLHHALEKAYTQLSMNLNYRPQKSITAILYSNEDFRWVMQGPHWMAAAFDGKMRIPVQSMQQPEKMERTLIHELAHAFIAEMSKDRAPSWVQEGLAQYEEGITLNPTQKATVAKHWISIRKLEAPFSRIQNQMIAALCYDQSLVLIQELIARYGRYALSKYLKTLSESSNPEAFQQSFALRLEDFDREAQFALQSRIQP